MLGSMKDGHDKTRFPILPQIPCSAPIINRDPTNCARFKG